MGWWPLARFPIPILSKVAIGELNERFGVLFATDSLRSRSPPGTNWRVRSPRAHFTRPNYLRKQHDQMKSMRETEESCLKFGLSTATPESRLRLHWRFFFKSGNFAQTSEVAVSLAEVSCQKSFEKVPGHHGPHDPATETNNVHVIVLDPLPSREVIID